MDARSTCSQLLDGSRLRQAGYHLRHVSTGKENVSHTRLFRFTERKGDEEQQEGTINSSEEEELVNDYNDAEDVRSRSV